jgi:hypothetical protein
MPDWLTAADLARFEDELRKSKAPVIDCLRPGLSEAEARQRAAAAGLKLPREALTWFSWHDGVELADWPPEQMLGPFQLLGLDQAIEGYSWRREQAVGEGPEFEDQIWSRRWLPFAVQVTSRPLAIDISGPEGAPAPVYLVDAQDWEESREPKCASMKAMVDLWTQALTEELWRWDDARRQWEIADESTVRRGAEAVWLG